MKEKFNRCFFSVFTFGELRTNNNNELIFFDDLRRRSKRKVVSDLGSCDCVETTTIKRQYKFQEPNIREHFLK